MQLKSLRTGKLDTFQPPSPLMSAKVFCTSYAFLHERYLTPALEITYLAFVSGRFPLVQALPELCYPLHSYLYNCLCCCTAPQNHKPSRSLRSPNTLLRPLSFPALSDLKRVVRRAGRIILPLFVGSICTVNIRTNT